MDYFFVRDVHHFGMARCGRRLITGMFVQVEELYSLDLESLSQLR